MRRLSSLLLVALALAMALPSLAQAQSPGPDYVLGPGDVIDIFVRDHPEYSKQVAVMPDGKIAVPEAGVIMAAGRTPAQVADIIKTAVEKLFNNVSVAVTVSQTVSLRVRVVGAIRTPGVYPFRRGMRLLDVVAIGGGFTSRPAMVKGKLVRGAQATPVNVTESIAKPDTDANPELQTDDLLVFEESDPAQNKVYVVGCVKSPGAFPLGDTSMALLNLLALAGNPTPEAALSKAYILRDNKEIPVNLLDLLTAGSVSDQIKTITVLPGDVLHIPPISTKFSVMGQVQKPGEFPTSELRELRVLDALSLAGGPTPTADLKKAGIFRYVDGKPTIVAVDIAGMSRNRDMTNNFVMQKDDVLFLPLKGPKTFTFQDLLGPATALYYMGFRIGK